MEEVFFDAAVNAEYAKKLIKSLFPGIELFQWMRWDGDVEPEGFNPDEPAHILFDIQFEDKRLEFKWRFTMYGPASGQEERARLIAKYLSNKLMTRVLVSYQLPEEPHNPFYNLLYSSGTCYLADDSMFSWSGEFNEPSEPIKILRPIDVPEAQFNSFGRIVK